MTRLALRHEQLSARDHRLVSGALVRRGFSGWVLEQPGLQRQFRIGVDRVRRFLKARFERVHHREIICRVAALLGAVRTDRDLELFGKVNLRVVIETGERPGTDPVQAHAEVPADLRTAIGIIEGLGKIGTSIII